MKFIKIVVILISLGSTLARADFATFAKDWTSATHFGYSSEDQSSTGFNKVAGSVFFLDISRHLGHELDLGLRTIGSGGEGRKAEFYRLGAGPLLSFRASKKWNLDFGASFFKESALNDSGDTYYTSEGQNVQFGWQRIFALTKGIEVSWGGFLARHWGDIDLKDTGETHSKSSKINQPARNIGNSRGLALGLRIGL